MKERMQLGHYLLPALISFTLLSGCSLFSGEDEVNKMSPLPKVTNQFTANKIWNTSVGNGIGDNYSNLHPAWSGDTIYAADRFGVVKAMDASTGKQQWKVDLSTSHGWLSSNTSALLSGGITVEGDLLYIGSERGLVYALHTKDGSLAFKTEVAGEALSSPVVSDNYLLIHTSNGILQALDLITGVSKWIVNLDVPGLSIRGESAPAVAYGGAIVGGDNGMVNAVILQQGQLTWQQRISKPGGVSEIDRLNDVDTTPIVDNGIVYALAYNGNLAALDLRSGQILWKREIGGVKDIIVENKRIYLVDQNDRIDALSSEGGVAVWRQSDLTYRNLTAPVIYNGYLVTADGQGYLHWLDISDGRFVSQQKVDSSGFQSKPLVASDKLLIQAKNGELYAFKR